MLDEFFLFSTLLTRLFGFFVLSPLFSQKGIPYWIRLGLTLTCSLLLLPPLSSHLTIKIENSTLFAIRLTQELAIGYLIGFLFSLLFEAAAFGGQVVGTLTGFSATELLDPLSNSKHPLISRLFILTVFALFLSLDLHHRLLRLLYDSYLTLSPTLGFSVSEAISRLFSHALSYALFPLSVLSIVIICFAFVSRFLPHLQIFWIGFPIQLLVGFSAIAFSVLFFSQILQNAFYEMWNMIVNTIYGK